MLRTARAQHRVLGSETVMAVVSCASTGAAVHVLGAKGQKVQERCCVGRSEHGMRAGIDFSSHLYCCNAACTCSLGMTGQVRCSVRHACIVLIAGASEGVGTSRGCYRCD